MRVRSILELPEPLRAQAAAQLSPSSLHRAREALKRERKYGNQPIVIDGERFDSKLEWRCCEWLRVRERERQVLWFTRQVPFRLEGGVVYRADFLAVLAAGGVEVIDAKGRDTRESRNKRKQVKARYGFEVMLWPK